MCFLDADILHFTRQDTKLDVPVKPSKTSNALVYQSIILHFDRTSNHLCPSRGAPAGHQNFESVLHQPCDSKRCTGQITFCAIYIMSLGKFRDYVNHFNLDKFSILSISQKPFGDRNCSNCTSGTSRGCCSRPKTPNC